MTNFKKNKQTTLGCILNYVPCSQEVIISDYLDMVIIINGSVGDVIEKLSCNRELREARVFGIKIEGVNILKVEILRNSDC